MSAATRSRLPGVRGRVEVTDKHLRIRLGVGFVGFIARGSIRTAVVTRTSRSVPPGATERSGGWTVHGRPGGAVQLDLEPAASVRVNGSSVRTSCITVGVDDPAGLVAALGLGPRVVRYTAAGCIVVGDGTVLVLARNGEVRLPKGHIDPGEVPMEAAVRELAEESGYVDVEVLATVGEGPVAFDRVDRDDGQPVRIERHEHWFLTRLASERTIPRPDGDLDRVCHWLPWDDALAQLTCEGEQAWAARARELLR